MIGTGINKRIQVQDIIDNQLPEFITSESPLTSDFLKQYYVSQEHRGGVIDLTDNLDQYLKLDNLTPEVIVGVTTLTSGIGTSDTTVTVSSTKGFPDKHGLFKIDDEIFTYTSKSSTEFIDVTRGFCGITSYTDPNNLGELVFSTSIADTHTATSSVENLSVLFLQEFYKKVKSYLTPGLEDTKLNTNVDISNFIKESKSLYKSKGTEESFRILFNVLYGISPKIIDLENLLIKPSSAEYLRREVIVAEQISGDPNKLVGQTITKSTDLNTSGSVSEVEIFSRSGNLGITTYYKLNLFVGYDERTAIQGIFTIPGKTRIIEDAPVSSDLLTVDSTVGFGTTGTLISNGVNGINTITYGDKTINQFLNCTGIGVSIRSTDDIRSDEFIFGYENGDLTKRVELRITGVLSDFELLPSKESSVTLEGEKITVKNLGEEIPNPTLPIDKTRKTVFFNSWLYNTASRFKLETTGLTTSYSSFITKASLDESNLKNGDKVSYLAKGSTVPKQTGITVERVIGGNQIELNQKLFVGGKDHDIQRELDKAVGAAGVDLEFGNDKITANVQNTYNDNDENYYVASSSMPSYIIEKTVVKSELGANPQIGVANNAGIVTGQLLEKNSVTELYSKLQFDNKIDFITGDAIAYIPSEDPLVGLDTTGGVYYAEVLPDDSGNPDKILRLYPSRSFITVTNVNLARPPYIEFTNTGISTTGTHKFVLLRHKNEQIGVQKILKKFPAEANIKSGNSVKTEVGTIGILKNGVEIANYKSLDKIYYGPLSDFIIFNQGKNFDVVNPPQISVPAPAGAGTTALIQPVVTGELKEVLVDQQNFDIERISSITLSGGNGSGAILKPIVTKRQRELTFDGRLRINRGGVDHIADIIYTDKPHNLQSGEPLIYSNNGHPSIGIGTFAGSNTIQNKTLIDGSLYYPEVVGISSIKLYPTVKDYSAGINTIGFTVENQTGNHKFTLLNLKNHLKSIKVIEKGTNYTNRKLIVKPVGITTVDNSVNFKDHGFITGDLIQYSPVSGDANHAPIGLGITTRYRVLKLDEDKFRLIDVGVGATDPNLNYLRKNFVRISEVSSLSNHQFFFEPVVLSVSAVYSPVSAGLTESIVATPKIRGPLTDGYLYESGTNYGSNILNFEKKPNIKILNGEGAELKPIILDGKIVECDVRFGGKDYTSAPDLDIVGVGTGIGGKLRAVVNNGKITEVKVINPGIGYTSQPAVKVTPNGSGFIIDSAVRDLNVNNLERFGDEILLRESATNLQYSVLGYAGKIQTSFGDTVTSPQVHSPIIGWAYDGNPIYGPYGYSESNNNSSLSRVLNSGYSLNSSLIVNRPSTTVFPAGFFVEDYVYDNSGDLDENNGRFCKTPDFPNGVYAYFASVSNINQKPVYPYFIGDTYRSDPIADNFTINQNNFDFNSSDLTRNSLPYKFDDKNADYNFAIESYEIKQQTSIIESVTNGDIDDFNIVSSGDNYIVGDSLNFDNTGTDGGGASALVSRVKGKDVGGVTVGVTTYRDVVFVRGGNGTVSGFISTTHNLNTNDIIVISGLTTSIPKLTGSHQIGVSSESTVLYKGLGEQNTAGIVTDIYLATIPPTVSAGSSIGIGTEKLLVLNTFKQRSILRVKRGIVGAAETSKFHTLGGLVQTIPQFLKLRTTDIGDFISKKNDIVYFNPAEAVGVAVTVGRSVSIGKSYTTGELSQVISIPAKSIFLPNHPFSDNQEVILRRPTTSPNTAFTIGIGDRFQVGADFTLPSSGVSTTVYVRKFSDDLIGIALTANHEPVFFKTGSFDNFEYSIESNYPQVKGKVERITATVGISTVSFGSTLHGLQNNDTIELNLVSNETKGIGAGSTSVIVKYDSKNDKLLINPTIFSNADVNSDEINIINHGFKTGQKLFYNGSPATGLTSERTYFVYRIDDDHFRLSETRYDVINEPPNTIGITTNSGGTQELSLVNPPIDIVRNDNLLFYVSDPSLNGYNLNFYFDSEFKNEFVSTGSTTNFGVLRNGTAGVGTTSTVTLRFDSTNPEKLFYTLEKTGFISTSDPDVKNGSQISYIDSEYNGSYTAFGATTGGFNISLNQVPEQGSYLSGAASTITYDTSSKNTSGGVSKINLTSRGFGYKNLPGISSITSVNGTGANILCLSSSINNISKVRITDPGFDYHSDKTLRPEARLSPTVTLINSDSITDIEVVSGGSNYIDAPDLVVIDPDTGNLTNDQGVIQVILAANSISSINILESPRGLTSKTQILRTINNTNGYRVTNVESSNSGIVTCTLKTPINGFATPQFTVGEKVFVENIKKGSAGTGFNSPDNGFEFFEVITYNNTDPAKLEFKLPASATNPGVADTSGQNFASVVKFSSYPQFIATQKSSEFRTGEKLAVQINANPLTFSGTGSLVLDNRPDEFIKIEGSYEFEVGDVIRGENSGTVATIDNIKNNKGRFTIDYSLRQNKGWNDEIGRLSEDFMVLADNNYYQNLAYTIQSPQTFDEIVDPVNRLVHTSGLKNFADTGITSTTQAGIGVSNATIVSADIITDQRVDAINNFDLAKDIDTILGFTTTSSKFVQLKNTKLAKFVKCNTNRVLKIDDISSEFSDSDANLTGKISVPFGDTFGRFLIQSRNIANNAIQLDEVVLFKDNNDTFTFEKNSVVSIGTTLVDIEGSTVDGSTNLNISPIDPNNDDIDIKVFKNSFNSENLRSGTTTLGAMSLVGLSTVVSVGTTAEPIASGSTTSVSAFYATVDVTDLSTNEKNHVDVYATHDGTNSYFSEYYADTSSENNFSSNFIGSFRSRIHNNILTIDFDNSSSVGAGVTNIQVRAKVVGFGTIGTAETYRFKDNAQPDGSETSLILQTGITSVQTSASTNVIGIDSNKFSAIKSIVKVGIGTTVGGSSTHAIHQVLAVHDGTDVHTIHYPFVSVGTTSGIGTFRGTLNSTNGFVLKFVPDSGTGKHHIQHYTEAIYRDVDLINNAPDLDYGRIKESLSVFQYNAVNGTRSNRKNFILKNGGVPIYEKGFDPEDTSVLNRSTGVFTIPNHFFSENEQLVYTPKSTFAGVGATTLQMSGGSNLPTTVFVKKLTNSTFQLATSSGGSAVTFTNVGAGNSHRLTMVKRLEKTVLNVDNIIQSPMAFSPVTATLTHNVGAGIGTTVTNFSVNTTTDINLEDSIKFGNEFMKVTSVGFGTTTVGPVTGVGTYHILGVERGVLGTEVASHNNGVVGRVFSGSFNIVGSEVFFSDAPKGTNNLSKDKSGLDFPRSDFQGRTYLRRTYTTNRIFDDLSTQFTGVGATFRMKSNGSNATGIATGSSLVLINGIFQKPTTENNLSNNYRFIPDGVSAQDIVFTGITSAVTGLNVIVDGDVNQNQLPRGGKIVSLGSSGGLGVAPLVGAAVTAILDSEGTITGVGIGSTVYNQSVSPSRPAGTLSFGSGYRPVGGTVSIGVTDLAYVHKFVSSGVGSIRTNGTGNNIFAGAQKTATNAEYISHTGLLTLTIASHGLSIGNFVGIDTGGIVFSCSRDDFQSNHAYPRAISKTTGLPDPIAGIATIITAKTDDTITFFVGFGGGAGKDASVNAQVGAGGTLDINIADGGENYVNPKFEFPQPSYDNMEVVGVSRNGVSGTTTGSNLLVTLNVGASSTVGIGSTLFEVTSFEIAREGHSFKRGDKFKPVGLVTARGAVLEDFILEVTEIYNDKFSSWEFGEFDYIDPITNLQDGVRTRFPLRVNGELLSFDIGEGSDSQLINMNNLLAIYVNNILQEPGEAYVFDGGTTFEFTTAPEANDNIAVFFYKGTAAEDISVVDAVPTLKTGDVVQLQANDDTSSLTNANTRFIQDLQQRRRTVSGITTTDTFETEIYTGVGINDSATNKPITWIKQKEDKVVNGIVVSKSRESIEPLIYPTAKIIGDIGLGNTSRIYVDDADFFEYEKDEDSQINTINFDAIIVNDTNQVSAALTAIVSNSGTITSIDVVSGGSGYVGATTSVHIARPPVPVKVSPIATGIGSTAVATANITNGVITSVTVNSGGAGYSQSIIPTVIVAAQEPPTELISDIEVVKGFSGIVTGISTSKSGSTMILNFGLQAPAGQAFTDLVATVPLYISETSVGHGVTSLNNSGVDGEPVAIGRTFLDNVYMVKSITSNSNNAEIQVAVHSNLNVGTVGIGNSIDMANYGRSFSLTLGASGTSAYTFTGSDRGEFSLGRTLSSAQNPTIYVEDGDTVSFVNGMNAHPFRISRIPGGAALGVSDGVTNNGAQNGTVVFNTTGVGYTTFHYQCTSHAAMQGTIRVNKFHKGKFSFGYLQGASSGNVVRDNPVAIGVTGNTVGITTGVGISTFPTIQRRGFGIRDGGALKRSHTP